MIQWNEMEFCIVRMRLNFILDFDQIVYFFSPDHTVKNIARLYNQILMNPLLFLFRCYYFELHKSAWIWLSAIFS